MEHLNMKIIMRRVSILMHSLNIICGAGKANHNHLFAPVIQKILQPQTLAEGGIPVKKEVVPVKYIKHRVALLTS